MTSHLLRSHLWLMATLAACSAASGAVPKTTPPVGLRENAPTTHALVGARIIIAPGQVIDKASLVLRDGVITAVGTDIQIPATARVWRMDGKTLYPGLIDMGGDLPAGSA